MPKNKPKQSRPVDTTKVSQMDVCQTPPHALEPLYPYLDTHWIVWESAVGPERLIQNTLLNRGFTVIGTDLMYGEQYNYFSYAPDWYDIEITNMPFSIKYEWLAKAFERGKRFALLAPYETAAAKEFKILAKEYNNNPWYIELLSPERRINFKMPNLGWGVKVWDKEKQKMVSKGESAQMPTMWITWGLDIYTVRSDYIRLYDVPMRAVKYNPDNTERIK